MKHAAKISYATTANHHSDLSALEKAKKPYVPPKAFLSEAQRQALLSGVIEKIKHADNEALASAMYASLHEKQQRPASLTHQRKVTFQEWTAHTKNNLRLRHWFQENNYVIKQNSGKENNCLLISLLQHATGDYVSQHTKRAQYYKLLLQKLSKGEINRFDPLYSDSVWTTLIINQINQDYGKELSVDFYSADCDGNPSVLRVGEGENSVVVFDQGGHFEAVIKLTES